MLMLSETYKSKHQYVKYNINIIVCGATKALGRYGDGSSTAGVTAAHTCGCICAWALLWYRSWREDLSF